MRLMARVSLLLLAVALVFTSLAQAQESESLGDVARQTREQKRAKDAESEGASAKDGENKSVPTKPSKVITNEEIPEHPEESPSTSVTLSSSNDAPTQGSSSGSKASAEQWKSQIQAQKNVVTSLKTDIEKVERSIQFAPGNCVSGCVQWNQHQKEKQEQVERMKADLLQQQNRLETMQETARHQGFGSSVYEP